MFAFIREALARRREARAKISAASQAALQANIDASNRLKALLDDGPNGQRAKIAAACQDIEDGARPRTRRFKL